LSFSTTQALLDQLLGVEIRRGAIGCIRDRLSAAQEHSLAEDLEKARHEPLVDVMATGAPIGNPDGNNPPLRRCWVWVVMKKHFRRGR
jgi:hypothetical protein